MPNLFREIFAGILQRDLSAPFFLVTQGRGARVVEI
jgi:hypothetical protein